MHGDDDRRSAPHQIGRQFRQPFEAAFGETIFEGDVAAFGVAHLGKALLDSANQPRLAVGAAEDAHHRHGRLLREHRQRRCRRCGGSEHGEKFAALHAMTSAVRVCSAETVRQCGRCASEELDEMPSLHIPLMRL